GLLPCLIRALVRGSRIPICALSKVRTSTPVPVFSSNSLFRLAKSTNYTSSGRHLHAVVCAVGHGSYGRPAVFQLVNRLPSAFKCLDKRLDNGSCSSLGNCHGIYTKRIAAPPHAGGGGGYAGLCAPVWRRPGC